MIDKELLQQWAAFADDRRRVYGLDEAAHGAFKIGFYEGVVAGLQVYQPDNNLAAAVEAGPLANAREPSEVSGQ